ncbi:O-antigen ligase family protein, partial [Klebsiella michiganensis]
KYGIVTDNVFISTMLETGIIGMILYLGMLASICYNAAMPQCRNAAMPQCRNAAMPRAFLC